MTIINSVKGKIAIGFILAIIVYISFRGNNNMTSYGMVVWLHVLSGITWIGILYYFNFIQAPAIAAALANKDSAATGAISKYIAPNALLWFRMAAALTWILGLSLLVQLAATQSISTIDGIIKTFTFSDGWIIIGIGSWFGTIMAFNVWFIIWPNQKKILGITKATADEITTAKKYAALASSVNVILSVPMLISMIAHRI